ncbi:MAG: asparagine synthase (glutamine-hydrolyzing) [Endozoicomonas sp.]
MCGVLGGIYSSALSNWEKSAFDNGMRKLLHRGPDDRGYKISCYKDKRLALGHTRLSIIDLSSSGHQPMSSPDGRYQISFNGEVYNYRELRAKLEAKGVAFKSDSDTEVLLSCWQYWGKECLKKLRGMFAFSILDLDKGMLYCARDAFGIKPFFYYQKKDSFFFSSEVPALIELLPKSPEADYQRAFDYLVYSRYDDNQETFFQDVSQLLPGHLISLDLNRSELQPEIERWWWPSITEKTDLTFDQAAEQLRELFLNNIRLHSRSDVEIGAALSGGLDSSAIVCGMRYLEPDAPIKTFSYIARQTSKNEEHWVDFINQHVSATPNKVMIGGADLSNDLGDLIRYQGEPFGSTSIYAQYRVFKEAKEKGVTVTLDGQGADELLAGYQGYPSSRFLSLVEQSDYRNLIKLIHKWSGWPGRSYSKALFYLLTPHLSDRHRAMSSRALGYDPSPEWLNSQVFREAGVNMLPGRPALMREGKGRRLVEELRLSLSGSGLASLLRHGDRNSMRWSLESRVPFLTTDMAEFLLSLPEDYLLSPAGETKHVFRHAMRGIVPDEILHRKDKVGFETPQPMWLGDMGAQLMKYMNVSDSIPFVNSKSVRREVKKVVEGRRAPGAHIWRLINYHCWFELYQG